MKDKNKTGEQLINELVVLRQRITELEAEHKRVEGMLREGQERFRSLTENTSDWVWEVGVNGIYTYVSPQVKDLLGYEPEEVIGKTPFDFMPPEEVKRIVQEFRDAVESRRPLVRLENTNLRKDGQLVVLETSGLPFFDADGQFCGYRGIDRDITERKQVEHGLSERVKELTCLYSIADIVERPGIALNELYQETAKLLPKSWQYPEVACAQITINGEKFKSTNYRETEWNQPADIKVYGEKAGVVEVCYLEERPEVDEGSFLKEERLLIDAVAERLGKITERKRAEEALRESEERYRAIVNLSGEVGEAVILLQDTDQGEGIHSFVNDEWPHITGYSREELLGMSFFNLAYPKDHDASLERHRSKMKGKVIPGLFEMTIIRKDGTEVPIELTSAYTTYKGEHANVVYIRDITERKRAEGNIKQAAEEWKATFDSITDMLAIQDKNYRIIRVNKAFADALKTKPEELIGKYCYEIVHGTNEPIPDCPYRKTMETKKSAAMEFFEPHLGIHVEGFMSPIFNEKGEVMAGVHGLRNITERKQTEERERQLHQELDLASRLACVGELASGVAHEINNPLTAVLGFSQMLAGRDVPEEMKEKLEIISGNAQRVAKIVRNLLSFARQHKAGRTYADINSLISGIIDIRAYEMTIHNIKATTSLAPDLPWTMADVGQLQQVFINIILNAEQATMRAHNEGNLVIKTEQKNNCIRISFKDDGPGIARENLDKIFDPFFTTKAVGEGTGLGLSVSYGIIKEHKGKIYARSKLGKGATFIIELPIVAEVQQLELDETAVKEPRRAGRARIMVVDDEPAICQFLSQVLTQEGHNVETIDNASAALERLKCERYNLILLDIRMKGMDGIELYRHIGEIASSLQRRVIFITGDTMTSGTRSFLDRTKARCIAKPFDAEQLKKEINQILREGM